MGDLMFVRAAKDIAAGEQLTLSYVSPEQVVTDSDGLVESRGSKYTCTVCLAEQAGDHHLRATLMEQVKAVCQAHNPHGSDGDTIACVEALCERIRQAYEIPKFLGPIARQGLVGAGMWLLNVYGRQASRAGQPAAAQTVEMVIAFGNDHLQSNGLGVAFAQEQLQIDYAHWVFHSSVTTAAFVIALAYNKKGNRRAAEQYVAFARKVYMIFYGELKGFEESHHLP